MGFEPVSPKSIDFEANIHTYYLPLLHLFLWAIFGLFFLYFRFFTTFNVNFGNDCIQTVDLWSWKRPLYQLSLNHCLFMWYFQDKRFNDSFIIFIKKIFKLCAITTSYKQGCELQSVDLKASKWPLCIHVSILEWDRRNKISYFNGIFLTVRNLNREIRSRWRVVTYFKFFWKSSFVIFISLWGIQCRWGPMLNIFRNLKYLFFSRWRSKNSFWICNNLERKIGTWTCMYLSCRCIRRKFDWIVHAKVFPNDRIFRKKCVRWRGRSIMSSVPHLQSKVVVLNPANIKHEDGKKCWVYLQLESYFLGFSKVKCFKVWSTYSHSFLTCVFALGIPNMCHLF